MGEAAWRVLNVSDGGNAGREVDGGDLIGSQIERDSCYTGPQGELLVKKEGS